MIRNSLLTFVTYRPELVEDFKIKINEAASFFKDIQGTAGGMRKSLEQFFDIIYERTHGVMGINRKVCLCRIRICA